MRITNHIQPSPESFWKTLATLVYLSSIITAVSAECRLRDHLQVLGDENIVSIDQYHFSIDDQQETFVTAGQLTITWDYFYQKGVTEGFAEGSQLFDFFEFFNADPGEYTRYVENEMVVGEDVPIAFTLAYNYKTCRKVWDAFYINLPGGILGVDNDNEGNFVVAGYDSHGQEYIIRHSASGALPDIWKFDTTFQTGGRIVPGGIFFAFNSEWICSYSDILYKAFRINPLSSPDHPTQNARFVPISAIADSQGFGGKFFAAVAKENTVALISHLSNKIVVQIANVYRLVAGLMFQAPDQEENLQQLKLRADHNDSLDRENFRVAICGFNADRLYTFVSFYIIGFERQTVWKFQPYDDNLQEADRFCLAAKQDDDNLDISWYLTYSPHEFKHYIGKLDVATGAYTERRAINEWRGYGYYFNFQSDSFYAKIDQNAIYLHATVSSISNGHELLYTGSQIPSDLGYDQNDIYDMALLNYTDCEDTANGAEGTWGGGCDLYWYIDLLNLCGNYDDDDFTANAMCCDCGGGELFPTNPDSQFVQEYGSRLVSLGVVTILESYQGIQRAQPFFEDESIDMSFYLRNDNENFQYLKLICYHGSVEFQCQEMLYWMNRFWTLTVNQVPITDLLMTPANNFVTTNAWSQNFFECQRIIREETISECSYEHVFTKYSSFMRDDLVDRGATQCEQDTVFDPETVSQAKPPRYTAAEYDAYAWNIRWRSDCYPLENVYGFDNIPIDDSVRDGNGDPMSMLIVNEEANTARWNENLTPAMQGGISRLIYSEMDHDGFQATLISVVFKVVDSLYTVKVFECGQGGDIDIKTEYPPQGEDPVIEIECISLECPQFIQFNAEEAKIIVSSTQSQSQIAAGTYIYRIWTTSNTLEPLTLGELHTEASNQGLDSPSQLADEDRYALKSTQTLNSVVIRLFFPTIETNAFLDTLSSQTFISGGSGGQSFELDKSYMTQKEILNVYETQYDAEAIEVISNWNQTQLENAIQEAWKRQNDIDQGIFVQKPTTREIVNSNGVVRITFTPEIELPSYLIQEKSRRCLQDAESDQALIDFLNDEYGQLQEYEDFDCEDGSDQDCAQVKNDELQLGQCDPSDEKCLANYCSLGDVQCIELRDATLFRTILTNLN